MLWESDEGAEGLRQQIIHSKIVAQPSSQEQLSTFLRIHGDNILECERALFLIVEAFEAKVRLVDSPPYLPRFEIFKGDTILYTVELLPGHKRWNFDLQQILQDYGAPLREATDAVVTQKSQDGLREIIKCAFEFCNALPAGNNAWQRNGRALACATVGIPYLYFADIGGVELDEHRNIKAPRFPNPIVPFSYITVGRSFNMMCLPVYLPSPSSTTAIREYFVEVFGESEAKQLVRQILEGEIHESTYQTLMKKAILAVEKLSERRRIDDTLRGYKWYKLLNFEDIHEKVHWLREHAGIWLKRSLGKVNVSENFKSLVKELKNIQFISVGARDIPICLVDKQQREKFALALSATYKEQLSEDFTKWVASKNLPLVIVWITGFKPRGDDSRPDRGLVPMARMLFGNDIDVLSIVYGPGSRKTWELLKHSPQQLANDSGLWQPILNLSDGVLADNINAFPIGLLRQRERTSFHGTISFPSTSSSPVFSEMDIDSTIHLLFARQESKGVFECLCNPPGGDWSGLSVFNPLTNQELRWTSLPRVSGITGKRPDHVIQFHLDNNKLVLLAIESKDQGNDVEKNVGSRLSLYVQQLIQTAPTIVRQAKQEWSLLTNFSGTRPNFSVISGGAFQWGWQGVAELDYVLAKSGLDIVFAVEFDSENKSAILHIKSAKSAEFLLSKINELSQYFTTRLKIQVH